MITTVVLDTGPLGMITNPKSSDENNQIRLWMNDMLEAGLEVIVPEIADYETRRELLRANKEAGIAALDRIQLIAKYLPVNSQAMKLAAEFWARARQEGKPTTPDLALDGDVILAGQVAALNFPTDQIIVATSNPGHIARFVHAKRWQEIIIGD